MAGSLHPRHSGDFYPRPPRGGRLTFDKAVENMARFLSTPSARRATSGVLPVSAASRYFYPRPPRGGRPCETRPIRTLCRFLSTPSARRATTERLEQQQEKLISIHALREEGDAMAHVKGPVSTHFYPRPPRGGRPGQLDQPQRTDAISIHALREEGDGTRGHQQAR